METIVYTVAYHGGTEGVIAPEIRRGRRFLDFGPAFYATHSREQAVRWAERQHRIRGMGDVVVTQYDISGLWTSGLSLRFFDGPTEEWLDAVVACRAGTDVFAGVDTVLGPVADDNVYETIRLYESGVYTREEAIRRLLTEKLFNQLAFKTEAALRFCRYVSHEKVGGA